MTDHGRAQCELRAAATSVGDARRFLRASLRDWGADQHEWTAAQVLSELVTNAVLHARTGVTVALELADDGALRLEVRDGSLRIPQQRRYGREATTGRGIALVAGLARTWGVDRGTDGKTVWCELAAPEHAGEPDLSAFLTLDELSDLESGRRRPA